MASRRLMQVRLLYTMADLRLSTNQCMCAMPPDDKKRSQMAMHVLGWVAVLLQPFRTPVGPQLQTTETVPASTGCGAPITGANDGRRPSAGSRNGYRAPRADLVNAG